MKVLVVEDNPVLRERIGRQFSKAAVIDTAENGELALQKVNDEYTVIVLDLGLPDMSGLDVCKRIRSAGIETPILILTADADVSSRVTLLNAGADDYLIKPFHGEELTARVKALARRKPHHIRREVVRVGDLVIHQDRRLVERDGTPIYLTRTEFDILEFLARNRGRVMTREMIFDRVWSNDAIGTTNVVDVHIKRLRDKIDRPFPSSIIHTAHGLGYVVDALEGSNEQGESVYGRNTADAID